MRVVHAIRRASLLDGAGLPIAKMRFKDFAEEATFLRKMVDSYSGDVALRELTLKVIFPSCRPKDEPAQALAIGKWVQDRTNYVHEGVETFQRPETTIRRKAGDCDDYSVLIASMLGTVGIRNKLCILKINGRWAHIFPVAIVVDGGRLHRLTLDGTLLKRKDEAPFDPDDDPISEMINPVAIVKARGDKVETLFV